MNWNNEAPTSEMFYPSTRTQCAEGQPPEIPHWNQFNYTSTTVNSINPALSHSSIVRWDTYLNVVRNDTIDSEGALRTVIRRYDLGVEYRIVNNKKCHQVSLETSTGASSRQIPSYRPIPSTCGDGSGFGCSRSAVWRGRVYVNGRYADDFRTIKVARDFEIQTDYYVEETPDRKGNAVWAQVKTTRLLNENIMEEIDFTSFYNGPQDPRIFEIPSICNPARQQIQEN